MPTTATVVSPSNGVSPAPTVDADTRPRRGGGAPIGAMVDAAWRHGELARLAGAGLEHGNTTTRWSGRVWSRPEGAAVGGTGDELALLRRLADEAAYRLRATAPARCRIRQRVSPGEAHSPAR